MPTAARAEARARARARSRRRPRRSSCSTRIERRANVLKSRLVVAHQITGRRLSRNSAEREAAGVPVHGRHGRVGRDLPVRRARRPRRPGASGAAAADSAAVSIGAETTPTQPADAGADARRRIGSDEPPRRRRPSTSSATSTASRSRTPPAEQLKPAAPTSAAPAEPRLTPPPQPLPPAPPRPRRPAPRRQPSLPRAGAGAGRAPRRRPSPAGQGFAVQIAALQRAQRGRRDRQAPVARRATRRTCWRRPTARRRSSASASASSRRAARPKRWRPGCKKKSSSSPGLRASRSPSGAAARAQFSEVRSSRVRLDRARAAARRARRGAHAARAPSRSASLTGVVYFTGTLYWITARDGGLRRPAAVGRRARQRRARSPTWRCFRPSSRVVVRRLVVAHGPPALMAAPFVWVATELGRTYVFTGFPWVLLGYSQVTRAADRAARERRSASTACRCWWRRSAPRWRVATSDASRSAQSRRYRARRPPLRSSATRRLVDRSWSRRGAAARVAASEWTRDGRADSRRPDPGQRRSGREVADAARAAGDLPGLPAHDAAGDRRGRGARDLARVVDAVPASRRIVPAPSRSATLARQARRADPRRQRSDRARRNGAPTTFYNSAFLVRPDGTTGGVYRKMHLVPFGEYVPLQAAAVLRGAARRRRCPTSRRATRPTLLPVGGHLVSMAICYEVVYPDLVRQFVAGGSELLTTITNDAWFGPTSAPYQHFEQASMRAIEEGRYLVRSANTGISGIVDPYGRVLAADRHLRAGGRRRRGAVPADVDVLRALRRRLRLRVGCASTARSLVVVVADGVYNRPHAHCRRLDAPLRRSQQARRRSAELSLRPLAPTKN